MAEQRLLVANVTVSERARFSVWKCLRLANRVKQLILLNTMAQTCVLT